MKGNLLVSYLFKSTDEIKNMDIKQDMITDLQHLAEKWKAQKALYKVLENEDCSYFRYGYRIKQRGKI